MYFPKYFFALFDAIVFCVSFVNLECFKMQHRLHPFQSVRSYVMSLSVSEALVNIAVQQMNPEHKTTTAMVSGYLQKQEQDNLIAASEAIESIEKKLKAARENNADPAVTNAYERILNRLSNLGS